MIHYYPQPLETIIIFSVSMSLFILCIWYKWNQTLLVFFFQSGLFHWAYFFEVNLSCSIYQNIFLFSFNRLYFLGYFQWIEKLSGKYWVLIFSLLALPLAASPTIKILYRSGAFVTTDEPSLTHYYHHHNIRVHTW